MGRDEHIERHHTSAAISTDIKPDMDPSKLVGRMTGYAEDVDSSWTAYSIDQSDSYGILQRLGSAPASINGVFAGALEAERSFRSYVVGSSSTIARCESPPLLIIMGNVERYSSC